MTDSYAVLGNPVVHSLSPVIHAYFAKSTGEDISYGRLLVPRGQFAETVSAFFKEGGRGCNITVPCKLDAMAYAREHGELTETAQAAGAVNTLKVEGDTVLGDNTDGRALTQDLRRLGCPLEGARVLLIGAGGAARGIILPLLKTGKVASVTLVNRTFEKARELTEWFATDKLQALRFEDLKADYDVVLNASSSSLMGVLPPVADTVLKASSFGYDLMYRPEGKTLFTEHLKSLGVTAHDGLGMLICQAAESFYLWRGKRPDVTATTAYLREYLASQ